MKPIFLILLTLVLASPVIAQDDPKVEVFGGYSYINIKPNFDSQRTSLNGWESNIAFDFLSGLDLEAELSGHYGSINGMNVNMHTFLFGLRFDRQGKKLKFFGHSLYGISRISGEREVLTPMIGVPATTGFAFVPFGAGIDINVNKKIAYRVFQFDLLLTNLGIGVGQLHPKLSTGVVFKIGKK
jgi:hypothetical protein